MLGGVMLALFMFVGQQHAQAQQIDPHKEQLIREMFRLTEVDKNMKMMLSALLDNFHQMRPEVPQEYWEYVKANVTMDTLIEISVEVYDRHFTVEELEGILKFYKTDIGQALIKKQPLVSRELALAGMEWGQEWGERLLLDYMEDDWRNESGDQGAE